MIKIKPQLVPGTIDLGPSEAEKKEYIISTIKSIFKEHNFLPLETPAMEKLEILKGIYGTENEKLIFTLSNSAIQDNTTTSNEPNKGLRYDLTVPLARYISMNLHNIAMPFKRYQIQNVWRADRPQKSRYREFTQCDIDTVGTDSLLCETEIIDIVTKVFNRLKLTNFTIRINHKLILKGIVKLFNLQENEQTFYLSLDKIDKTGIEKFKQIISQITSKENVENLIELIETNKKNEEKLNLLYEKGSHIEEITHGINQLNKVLELTSNFKVNTNNISIDLSLARGLTYYTGAIFEVIANDVSIGSIGGGGRYANITQSFSVEDISGAGFSFGINRIYDVLEELSLFPSFNVNNSVMICNFDKQIEPLCINTLIQLRSNKIQSEIYPDNNVAIKKQLKYASKKEISHVILIGAEEKKTNKFTLRHMKQGTQETYDLNEIIEILKNNK